MFLAFFLAAVAFHIYRRETVARADRLKWLLPTLRGTAVFLAVLALTGPILYHERVIRELGKLFVFVDGSRSMEMTDETMSPERKVAAMQAMGMLPRDKAFRDVAEASAHLARARFVAERALTAGPESADLAEAAAQFAESAGEAFEAVGKMSGRRSGFAAVPGLLLAERYPADRNFFDRSYRLREDSHPAPLKTRFIDSFRIPETTDTEFTLWVRGYLVAPADGSYRFWMASDDQGQLLLSPDQRPERAELIARVDSFVPEHDYDGGGSQRSRGIELKKGERYYMEAIVHAGGGQNHLSVAWQPPQSGERVAPIPGGNFIPIKPAGKSSGGAEELERYRELIVERARTLARDLRAGNGDPFAHLETLRELDDAAIVVGRQLRENVLTSASAYYAANAGNESFKEKLAEFEAMSRVERIEKLLLDEDQGVLARLAEQQDIEFVALREGEADTLWWQRRGGRRSAGPLPYEIELVEPGSETDLGAVIKETIGEAEKGVGVLVFSDGQHNVGSSPVAVAKLLGEQGIPMFTVGAGAVHSPEDMAVVDVVGPQSVFSKDRVKGLIEVRDNMRTAREFDLRITHEGRAVWEESFFASGAGKREFEYDFPVEELVARIQRQRGDEGVEASSVPLSFKVEVKPRQEVDPFDPAGAEDARDADGGADGGPAAPRTPARRDRLEDNDSKPLYVQAIAQPRRVLLIDARPRWETRYLHNMFQRDEQWEVNALMEVFTSEDRGRSWERGERDGMFPSSRDELYKYESVVIGDVPVFLFKEEELEWLADFVESRGGGMVFIDGQRGHLRAYAGTPIGKLLPVEWLSGPVDPADRSADDLPTSLFLSSSGAEFAPLRFASTGSENEEIWARLRAPHWTAQVRDLPGTEVLARAQYPDDRRLPALVLRRIGAGKVMYSATDELWRWRYNVADRYHQKFWVQLVNWVGEKPYSVVGKRASIGSDKLVYSPGDTAVIRVRVRDEKGRPVSKGDYVAVLYDRDGAIATEVQLEADENGGGIFRGRSGALQPGEYEIAVRQKYFLKKATEFDARAELIVKDAADRELDELALDSELMKTLARSSGGQFFLEEETHSLVNLLESIDRKKVIPSQTVLWSSYWWFAAIIGLLTAEWILRKKAGFV